jgi:dTDP-4-dehydrorhamnose reductase
VAFSNNRPVEIEGISAAEQLDLNDLQLLERPLLDGWPQLIINAAAVADYQTLSKDPAAAARINVNLPTRLAEISNHIGARFLHLSSDMVFDGVSPPYRSTDVPNPLTTYGKQKLEAEKAALQACSENLVVLRITIVNGNSPSGRRSVHEQLLQSLSKGERPTLFEDEYRQPCSCNNVADVLVDLGERPNLTGLFHWGGAERISRYEMGCRILQRFALPVDLIESGSRKDFSGEGTRPPDLAFVLSPLDGKLKTKPATVTEQLEEMAIPDELYEWYRDNTSDQTSYLRRFTLD